MNAAVSTDAGDGQAGQRPGAEVADDGGVGEQVQGLGGQRTQGGHRQPRDLPVVRRLGAITRHGDAERRVCGRGVKCRTPVRCW